LVDRARAALDAGSDALNQETLSRLQQARQTALKEMGRGKRRRIWLGFPAAGLAAAAAAVLIVVFHLGDSSVLTPYASPEDVEIIASTDQLELYEDLDFYTWLAEVRERAG
jgi:hypothetical protein